MQRKIRHAYLIPRPRYRFASHGQDLRSCFAYLQIDPLQWREIDVYESITLGLTSSRQGLSAIQYLDGFNREGYLITANSLDPSTRLMKETI